MAQGIIEDLSFSTFMSKCERLYSVNVRSGSLVVKSAMNIDQIATISIRDNRFIFLILN